LNAYLAGNTSFTFGSFEDYGGTGALTVLGYQLNCSLSLASSSPNFSGGWNIQSGLNLVSMATNALGTGPVCVSNATVTVMAVSDGNAGVDTNLPSITVWNGGTLGMSGTYNVAPGRAIAVNNGGAIGASGASYHPTAYLYAPVYVSGNVTATSGFSMNFMSDFSNSGPATVTLGGYWVYLAKASNAYTGNWIVPAGINAIYVTADGGMGTGAVDIRSALTVSANQTLYNQLDGNGAIANSGHTLTLKPWYTNATLYTAGVAPGTNFGAAIGTLAVAGNLSFTNLPNYDGVGHNADCRMTIKFGGTQASPSNDLLTATGNILGLSNVDLTVSAANTMAIGTYPILLATNNFSGQTFHSVTFSGGATGRVLYNNYNVQVQFQPSGTVFFIQ
jgi:hypothetical protein